MDDMPTRPRVSVVIATLNRAEMLRESIFTVLNQSFEDFELIIVDDGSIDNTENVVKSFDDRRIRYFKTAAQPQGISAARNLGARVSRGEWTAVHDDDDLMLPHRLERQLSFADEGVDFIYGAFVNFNNESGKLELHHGRNMTYGSAIKTGFAPGHSTWLVRTDLIRKFKYDEGLESAVDNNLAFRMLRSGIRMVHSGAVCLLRRVHSGRITDTGGSNQKYAAKLNLKFLESGVNSASRNSLWKAARYDWGPVDKDRWELQALNHLPDSLVVRSGAVYKFDALSHADRTVPVVRESLSQISLQDFFQMSSRGDYLGEVKVRLRESDQIEDMMAGRITEKESTDEVFRAIAYWVSRSSTYTHVVVIRDSLPNHGTPATGQVHFDYDGHTFTAVGVESVLSAGEVHARWTGEGLEPRVFEASKMYW